MYANKQEQLLLKKENDIQWIFEATRRYSYLQRQNDNTAVVAEGSLISIVDRISRQFGMRGVITEMRPTSDSGMDSVRISFDRVLFADMLYWLEQLSNQGMSISALSVRRTDMFGYATGTVTVLRSTT